MDAYIIVLFVQVIFNQYISAQICVNSLVKAYDMDVNQRHIREYLRNIACSITTNTLSFYRCKVECMRQESCLAFRYVSSCELCEYSTERNAGDLDLDYMYVKSDAEIIDQNLGNKKCFFFFCL